LTADLFHVQKTQEIQKLNSLCNSIFVFYGHSIYYSSMSENILFMIGNSFAFVIDIGPHLNSRAVFSLAYQDK